jgi:hypothetical protein
MYTTERCIHLHGFFFAVSAFIHVHPATGKQSKDRGSGDKAGGSSK